MESNMSVNNAAAGVHGAVDRTANAAANAAEEVLRKAKPAIDRATRVAHQVVDKAAGVAVPTADWLSAKADVMLAAPEKLCAGGRQMVIDHPWKTLGAVLAVGLLVGRALR